MLPDVKFVRTWKLEESGLYFNNRLILKGEELSALQVLYALDKAGVIQFNNFIAPPDNIPLGKMPEELTLKNFGSSGEKYLIN